MSEHYQTIIPSGVSCSHWGMFENTRKFPIDGCWSDMRRDGLFYECMSDSVWRKTDECWVKVA